MALGSTRRQLNSIMVGEGVLLLVLAFIPSLVISFNIAHMDLIDTYQLPFTWLRFAICGGITFVLIVLMIICGPLDSPLGAGGGSALRVIRVA